MDRFSFSYQQTTKEALEPALQELIGAAEAAAGTAYAPYSHFKVGAALRLSDGRLLAGANHENASFPAGICAERAVLGTVHMDEPHRITDMAIVYQTEKGGAHPPLSPCGICRQSILEAQLHQGSPIRVYMCSPDGPVIAVEDASALLPFHFSGAFL